MAVGYYECHITMLGNPEKCESLINQTIGWHFSKIDGDPVLGSGVKNYATRNFKKSEVSSEECVRSMKELMTSLIKNGIKVTRIKVEDIIYDERF